MLGAIVNRQIEYYKRNRHQGGLEGQTLLYLLLKDTLYGYGLLPGTNPASVECFPCLALSSSLGV